MTKIDFELKGDRELLIVIAQTCNAIDERLAELNGTVRQHSERLATLEADKSNPNDTMSLKHLLTYAGIGAAIIGTIIGIIGKVAGWW